MSEMLTKLLIRSSKAKYILLTEHHSEEEGAIHFIKDLITIKENQFTCTNFTVVIFNFMM